MSGGEHGLSENYSCSSRGVDFLMCRKANETDPPFQKLILRFTNILLPVDSPCSQRALWCLEKQRGGRWCVVCGVLSGDGYTLHVKPVGQQRLLKRLQHRSAFTDFGLTFGVRGNYFGVRGIIKVQVLSRF